MSSDRWQVTPVPMVAPGKCAVCGYADKERTYLDPRLDFEFYGAFLLCSTCGEEVGRLVGLIRPEQYDAAVAESTALATELVKLRSRLAAAEAYLVSTLGTNPVIDNAGSDDPDAESSLLEESEGLEGVDPEDSESGEGDQSPAAESPDESGPDDAGGSELPHFTAELSI